MSHSPYTVTTTPIVGHTLCGMITYTATFEGAIVESKTFSPVTYDQSYRMFLIFSEDVFLIGTRTLTVSAKLTSYPIIATAAPMTTQIEITDLCMSSTIPDYLYLVGAVNPLHTVFAPDDRCGDWTITDFTGFSRADIG